MFANIKRNTQSIGTEVD